MSAQDLSFFETFTDHAVLQRGVEHPVWGWAKPKARVTVSFGGTTYKTKAGADGRWAVMLPAQPAGGPHELSVVAKREEASISDVYFGDVFLLSGQSNMEWRLRQSDPGDIRAKEIADPLIREIKVNRTYASYPQDRLELSDAWRPGTAENIREFSGVGSYFAHYVRKDIDVPIGLLHSSWGGSRIEAWMPAATLGLPEGSYEPGNVLGNPRVRAALETYATAFGEKDPPTEDRGEELGYLKANADYEKWPTISVPGMWESNGYQAVNGHFYFARYFDVTAEQAAGKATLFLGAIDDSDWTYINGKMVGETYAAYAEKREYAIDPGVLRKGRNVIMIRVEDTGGGGGLYSSPETLRLSTAAGEVPLAGDWHYQIGSFSADQNHNQISTILYNKMIHPLAGMPLTGILWYQGESNAGPADAVAYADQFKTMITNWREHFERADLPFYWVQLANFQSPQSQPDEVGWGTLRESQTAALELDNTGEAVIIDIGEADDIHPRNKWEVGRRLSLHALKNIYEKDIPAASPRVTSGKADGGIVTLQLQGGQQGMVIRGGRYGYPKGFTYRTKSGEWKWAKAMIDPAGNEILIIGEPDEVITAVRYAYANNPADANVYTTDGLPLTPFHLELE